MSFGLVVCVCVCVRLALRIAAVRTLAPLL